MSETNTFQRHKLHRAHKETISKVTLVTIYLLFFESNDSLDIISVSFKDNKATNSRNCTTIFYFTQIMTNVILPYLQRRRRYASFPHQIERILTAYCGKKFLKNQTSVLMLIMQCSSLELVTLLANEVRHEQERTVYGINENTALTLHSASAAICKQFISPHVLYFLSINIAAFSGSTF